MTKTRSKAFLSLAVGIGLLALLIFLLLIAYGRLKTAQTQRRHSDANGKLQVLVAVDPFAYLAERVGGEFVRVSTLTPAGKSPETFSPSPSQLAEFSSAQLFFLIGVPVEERFQSSVKSLARDAQLVDLREGIELIPEPEGHAHRHEAEGRESEHDADHEAVGEHEHMDPHIWTSPEIARRSVARIADAYANLDPEHEAQYRENARVLDEELVALQRETSETLSRYAGRFFLVFHPAYGYYAHEFGLEQRAIETDGKAPKPRELEQILTESKQDKVRAILVQPEFNGASAQVVAKELDAELIVHSPLEKDYFANTRALTAAILHGFEASKDAASPVDTPQ